MTLIVGIKCSNGIVLGADGAATLGQPGHMPTALQPYCKKLTICQGSVIFGLSGSVGVGQRLCGLFNDLYAEKKFGGMKIHTVMQTLRETFWNNCLGPEYQIATHAKNILPGAANTPQCGAVVAMSIDGKPAMIQFDATGAPEAATKDLNFLALGSGQNIADPFLAFIRRIFWEGKEPNLAEGEFAVWWTLHHAIKTAFGGISDPKQIVVLEKPGKDYVARELTEAEFKEHEAAVGEAEKYLREFQPGKKIGGDGAAPKIPDPQSQ